MKVKLQKSFYQALYYLNFIFYSHALFFLSGHFFNFTGSKRILAVAFMLLPSIILRYFTKISAKRFEINKALMLISKIISILTFLVFILVYSYYIQRGNNNFVIIGWPITLFARIILRMFIKQEEYSIPEKKKEK